VRFRSNLLQVVLRNPAGRVVMPADLIDLSVRTFANVACEVTSPARVIDEKDFSTTQGSFRVCELA